MCQKGPSPLAQRGEIKIERKNKRDIGMDILHCDCPSISHAISLLYRNANHCKNGIYVSNFSTR